MGRREDQAKYFEEEMKADEGTIRSLRESTARLLEVEQPANALIQEGFDYYRDMKLNAIANIRHARDDAAIDFYIQRWYFADELIHMFAYVDALSCNHRRTREDLHGFVEAYMTHNDDRIRQLSERLTKQELSAREVIELEREISRLLSDVRERLRKLGQYGI